MLPTKFDFYFYFYFSTLVLLKYGIQIAWQLKLFMYMIFFNIIIIETQVHNVQTREDQRALLSIEALTFQECSCMSTTCTEI